MKVFKKMALLLAVSGLGLGAQAQKIKKKSGDISDLKNQTEMNLEFTYDNMAVGKYKNEADYIARKKEEYNKKKPAREIPGNRPGSMIVKTGLNLHLRIFFLNTAT